MTKTKSTADANFISHSAKKGNYKYFSYKDFNLEGFPWYEADGRLYRLPLDIINDFNPNMQEIAKSTSGGLIRFRTNTSKMAVYAKYDFKRENECMQQSVDAGFDLYIVKDGEYEFAANFRPNLGENFLDMEKIVSTDGKMCECILYFPLFSWVRELEIGIEKDAVIEKSQDKKDKKILFYGSSVTHGGTACRPGLTYPAILSRMLEAEFINLGYAGNCKGEEIIAQKISNLKFDAFVMEYDHNEADPNELKRKHESFFKIIMQTHKDIPVVFMSRPDFSHSVNLRTEEFKNVVKTTYQNAINNGDNNVYFIDGRKIFDGKNRSDFSSDKIHPNDMGFYVIAENLYDILNDKL